ncbi:HD domain-containing protein, partial [Ruminococcaceae bacterium OttesenSCG-928-L11]|nr:HD domain-containing protein [Ruminococcaceae bacterium OttesenSCG-928-L11]
MDNHSALVAAMIRHEQNCPERVHHFLAVHGFARAIGQLEGLDAATQLRLETAAIVHDIGIRPSLERYGDAAGPHQEAEGPPVARPMLEQLGYEQSVVERVCFLISRHHTYTGVDGMDWQILLEADFLVNAAAPSVSREAVRSFCDKVFITGAGKQFLRELFWD